MAISWKPVNDSTAYQQVEKLWRRVDGYGLLAKGYDIPGTFGTAKHLGIVTVPRRQRDFVTSSVLNNYQIPRVQNRELYGDLWVTTAGGEPNPSVPPTPDWKLRVRFNRDEDLYKLPNPAAWLPVPPIEEFAKVVEVLLRSYSFPNDQFDYDLTPTDLTSGYNSKSFLSGLLNVCEIAPPGFFTMSGPPAPIYPGSQKPVLPQYYQIILPQ